jgi:hypothetical protein
MGLITTGFLFSFFFFRKQELPPHRVHLFIRSVKMMMEKKLTMGVCVEHNSTQLKTKKRKKKKRSNHDK